LNYSYDDVLRSFADDNYYFMGNSDVGEIAERSAKIFSDLIKQPNTQYSFESALLQLQKFPSLEERLSKFSVPTLILWGDKDRMVPVQYADQFKAIPHSELRIIQGCGHYVCLQKPIEFSKAVLEFLIQ